MKIPADFRPRVLARQWLAGTFLNLGSSVTVEIAGLAGFDWVLIDHEHGPGGEDTLLHQLQACAATPAFPVVRVAANEGPRFKRALDMGANGVMVPYVGNAAEARQAASALRYPPHGVRGIAKFSRASAFGAEFEDCYRNGGDRLLGIMQIESEEGVRNCDEIAAVDGADVLFVGPTDLSYNLGLPDQLEHPRFVAALSRVAEAARTRGKAAGILVHQPQLVPWVRSLGYTFVALGSDGGGVRQALLGYAATLRAAGI